MRFFAAFLVVALFVFRAEAAPEAFEPKVIRINGVITATTLFNVSQSLSGWSNKDEIPGGLLVLLNSPGGDGDAAMAIGHLLRQKKAQTFVTGRCESACVFILASGVARAARSRTVGVHAGRLTISDPQGKVLKEVDATRSLNDSFKLTSFNSAIRNYFAEMDIEHGLLDVILAHQTKQTYQLTEQEMKQYRLVGFDNEYFNQRVAMFEKLPDPERVNRIELYNRTLKVPSLCQISSMNNNDFISCYKAVLFTGQANRSAKKFR
jgi:hypothetical protein